MQKRMLARCADWVKPGGSLVYSVCSLEPEEGEEVAAALKRNRPDYSQIEARRVLPNDWIESGGADSFFMTHFRRG